MHSVGDRPRMTPLFRDPLASTPRRLRRAACHVATWILAAAAIPGGAIVAAPDAHGEPTIGSSWTAATPDEMVDQLFARARKRRRRRPRLARRRRLARRPRLVRPRAERPRRDRRLGLAARRRRALARPPPHCPPPPPAPGPASAPSPTTRPRTPTGWCESLAILGPFQDTGGGLMRLEGPEAAGRAVERHARPLRVGRLRRRLAARPPRLGHGPRRPARPLHPPSLRELHLPRLPRHRARRAPAVVLHVGASGAVRVIWDGADVAASDDVHTHLVVDRLAARIDAAAGDHLVAVKVCTAAVGDEGRVRLRFTDEQSRPLPLATSSDLSKLALPASARPRRSATRRAPRPRSGSRPTARPAKASATPTSRRSAEEEARRRRRSRGAAKPKAPPPTRLAAAPGRRGRRPPATTRLRPRPRARGDAGRHRAAAGRHRPAHRARASARLGREPPRSSRPSPPRCSARSAAPTTPAPRARPACSIASAARRRRRPTSSPWPAGSRPSAPTAAGG